MVVLGKLFQHSYLFVGKGKCLPWSGAYESCYLAVFLCADYHFDGHYSELHSAHCHFDEHYSEFNSFECHSATCHCADWHFHLVSL